MAAPLLDRPPDDGHLWIPPGALGPGIVMRYTLGRNDGGYLGRAKRNIITMEISHTMGGSSTESMQGFANSEMPAKATLAEVATFTDGAFLQSLPLDIIGAGSVKGCATGLTHESAELAGDPNAQPWTPAHLATKVALTTWLIRNPLLAAGDRKWGKLQIRLQIVRNPYAPTPDVGGLGDHTMWDTCGVAMGGTNPWTLYCKSCPGWERRGTTRKVQFPTSQVTDIPLTPGNFRDYYEQVGRRLAPPHPAITIEPGDDDMADYIWRPPGIANAFAMPALCPISSVAFQAYGTKIPIVTEHHLQSVKAATVRNGMVESDWVIQDPAKVEGASLNYIRSLP